MTLKSATKGAIYANLGILAQVSDAQAIAFNFPHQATALKKENLVLITFAKFSSFNPKYTS